MSIPKITKKNSLLVYLSVFCLFSSLLIIPNVQANSNEECKDYPDQEQFNDCTGVDPLQWDDVNSDEEVVVSGVVAVTVGKAPYTWKIQGSGFYFDSSYQVTEFETDAQLVNIYATPEACGSATISVSDGCSTASGAVRATVGEWKLVEANATECKISGGYDEGRGDRLTKGKYMLIQNTFITGGNGLDPSPGELCPTVILPRQQHACLFPFYGNEDILQEVIPDYAYWVVSAQGVPYFVWCFGHNKNLYEWKCPP